MGKVLLNSSDKLFKHNRYVYFERIVIWITRSC